MAGKRGQTSPVGSPTSGNISDKEQDRFLPIANVSRIMKKSLPANAKISKEAKETVQECVSEFISFITGEASDKCQREKRKTINGDDLLWAMTTLGFENYIGPLKVYLNKYRETEGEKNSGGARPEDQDHHHHQYSPETNRVSGSNGSVPDFQGFGGGFYSLETQVSGNGHGNGARLAMDLPGQGAGFVLNRMGHESGDGNGSRAAMAAAQLHHRVGW